MSASFKCLLCNNTGAAELVSGTIRDVQSPKHKVFRCLCCGHVQISPIPTSQELIEFYKRDQQTQNVHGTVTDINLMQVKSLADTMRRLSWLDEAKSIEQVSEIQLLDIGCGYGFFVDAANQRGYRATGLDVGTKRLELARSQMQGEFIEGEVYDLLEQGHEGHFNVVTLFHVLEHIADPVVFLSSCFRLLAPDGLLLIEIPNLDDHMLRNESYQHWFWQFAHLSYFDRARLILALKRADLQRFTIKGVQRYGLRNHLHWIDFGKPQINDPAYSGQAVELKLIDSLYRSELERTYTCDTLTVEVRQ